MNIDFIIPTYQNEAVLPQVLQAIDEQKIPAGTSLRLILSDDGSTDSTKQILNDYGQSGRWPSELVDGPHGGAAAARNRAITKSKKEIIFLLGADIILRPGALHAHCLFHESHRDVTAAALGVIAWDPRLRPTPFMEWMIHGGPQNDYDALLGSLTCDPRHYFYASHLSLKRALISPDKFSEEFASYGWEDLELGRRLAARGLTLQVLTQALGLHHHRYTAPMIAARMQASGRGLHIYQRLHPDHRLLPTVSIKRQLFYTLIVGSGLLAAVSFFLRVFNRLSLPRVFRFFTEMHFWAGIINGQRQA